MDVVKDWETCTGCGASIFENEISIVLDSGSIALGPNDPDPPDFWEEGIVYCTKCDTPNTVIRVT